MDAEKLFFIGVILMAAAAVLAVVMLIVLRVSGRRLNAQLDTEFGADKA